MAGPLQLDYARAPRWYRRRSTLRALALGVLLLVVLAAFHWRKPLWLQAQVRYWEWQCSRYTLPPDRVVFSTDPAVIAALAQDPRYVIDGKKQCAILAAPACWNRWCALTGQKYVQPGLGFVHGMRSPRGETRLVAITWGSGSRRGWVYHRAAWRDVTPQVRPTCLGTPDWIKDRKSGPVTLYAPQEDPAAPTRLVVAFDCAGQRGAFDIVLANDDRLVQHFAGVAVSVLTP